MRCPLPLCSLATGGSIPQVGTDSGGTSLCTGSAGSCCLRRAELSCFSNIGAFDRVLPVEKKMTDSLCGAWKNVCPPTSLRWSSWTSMPATPHTSSFSAQWDLVWRKWGTAPDNRCITNKNRLTSTWICLAVEFELKFTSYNCDLSRDRLRLCLWIFFRHIWGLLILLIIK